MNSDQKPRIAFFGLGTMGSGMANRLLKAGYPLTVYNRNPERAAAFAAAGARVAKTPHEAAQESQVLISMLADDGASRAVWLGDHGGNGSVAGANGALAGAQSGTICIECSTLTVKWVLELAAAAESRGLKFLDAPVTGTKPHAANGELNFLVGGPAVVLEQVRPILVPMSKEILHLGPIGSGAALKLANNFLCGVEAVALAEADAFLHNAGIDLGKALPFLLNGAPGSPVMRVLSARHAQHDYTPNFQLRLLAKDLSYAIAEGQRHRVELRTAVAAVEMLQRAMAAGFGDEDMSAIIKFMEQFSGG
jgi:3-hydroxyisobutyrate dehydrogenase